MVRDIASSVKSCAGFLYSSGTGVIVSHDFGEKQQTVLQVQLVVTYMDEKNVRVCYNIYACNYIFAKYNVGSV
jgi:hypothetical protein